MASLPCAPTPASRIDRGRAEENVMALPRSYLFVPGNRPDRFAKAAASGADRIILGLEDAVGPEGKDEARRHVAEWLSGGGAGMVRINGADTPWFQDDLAAVAGCTGAEAMVPKADAEGLRQAAAKLPGRPVVALVETVAGLLGLDDLAAVEGVARLAFGNLDFGTDARIPGAGVPLDPARFRIVIASRLAGLPPPIDGVTTVLDDEEVLRAEVAHACALGFTAKLCIHPRQVAPVNEGLSPTRAEIDWAARIVDAVEESAGAAVQVDGKMVDRPVLARAQAILAEADGPGGARL